MLNKIYSWFLSLFKKSNPAPAAVVAQPVIPREVPPPAAGEWVDLALSVSQSFEGDDPWANITGNFDGAGLTCGALGWTFKWSNQQPLVKKFLSLYGEQELKMLMPKTGVKYIAAVNSKESIGMDIVRGWSNGSSKVSEPYRSELRSFWKDIRMINIQKDEAKKTIGKFAQTQTDLMSKFLGMEPKPYWYCMFFDQGVQNGTGKLIDFNDAKKVKFSEILSWCKSGGGDANKNAELWNKTILPDKLFLLQMAYLRARISNPKYQHDVMNRRGTIAMGFGHVHGRLRSLPWS